MVAVTLCSAAAGLITSVSLTHRATTTNSNNSSNLSAGVCVTIAKYCPEQDVEQNGLHAKHTTEAWLLLAAVDVMLL